MNSNKVCFVICTNNDVYLQECEEYINRLNIPDGFEIDILEIKEASGICEAYNAAIDASDAKYKVYLHQDTFVIEPNFINKVLDIFADESIGMIGVAGGNIPVGAESYAAPGKAWGNVLVCEETRVLQMTQLPDDGDGVIDVQAVDGLIIITQYDVTWDEKTFDGFHYYDLSQSIRMGDAGYRVVVPAVKERPWVIHDSGVFSLSNHEKYRRIFCEKFKDKGFEIKGDGGEQETLEAIYNKLSSQLDLFLNTEPSIEEAEEAAKELLKIRLSSNLLYYRAYCDIVAEEIANSGASSTKNNVGWKAFREYYHQIKLWVWRVAMMPEKDTAAVLKKMVDQGMITETALTYIVRTVGFAPDYVLKSLAMS